MQTHSVSAVARQLSQQMGVTIPPQAISTLFYKRRLDDSRCPVVGGHRLIPDDYIPAIRDALCDQGLFPKTEMPSQPTSIGETIEHYPTDATGDVGCCTHDFDLTQGENSLRSSELILFPHRKKIVAPSTWQKKKLADVHVEALLYCQYKCSYCSSNAGRHLKTIARDISEVVLGATGAGFNPHNAPGITIGYAGIVEALEAELAEPRNKPGKGKTLVYSQLTDGFSPELLKDGTARRILELLIERTDYRIRILTKNPVVGTSKWIKFFQRHAERFVVGLSIGTLDDEFARELEVGVPRPSSRISALRALQSAGVKTYGMLCPVFPAVLQGDHLERLLEAIRPELCEHVWAEPYNDRQNWSYVRDSFDSGSFMWKWMTQVYEEGNASQWSRYATELYSRIRDRAVRDGWVERLNYLLYEAHIAEEDADCFRCLSGVLLQSSPDDQGLSRHPKFALFQSTVREMKGL